LAGSAAAQNVWNSDFAAVYNMAQDPSGGADCIIDSTANANHGTPNGSMTSDDLVDGGLGKAIDFDGTDDWIDCGDHSDFDITAKITLCAEIYPLDYVNYRGIISKVDSFLYVNHNYGLFIDSAGYRGLINGDANFLNEAAANQALNEWKLLHMVYDGAEAKLYINGIVVDSQAYAASINVATGALKIGEFVGQEPFRGKIANTYISNNSMPPAWVKADYHAQTNDLLTIIK
jgi:hypothetical protein